MPDLKILNYINFKEMTTLKNKVQLIGFLGKDAEIKRLDNGKVMAIISLATSENYKNAAGKKVTDTQWHNLIAWGKTAEFLEKYTTKGSEIGIEGKLMNRSYEDKNGVKRYVTEVFVSEVLLMNAKRAEKEAA
jgi:single-strand DNA-binding protein